MSAIKQYFNRAREVEQQYKVWEANMIAKLEVKKEEEILKENKFCEEEFSKCDSLLQRDWSIDEIDINDLIQELQDDAFYKIVDNAHMYSKRIQDILYRYQEKPYLNKLSIKVKELDDDGFDDLKEQQEVEQQKQFDNAWEEFKTEQGLTRPEGEHDNEYNELYDKLNKLKTKLEEVKSKPIPSPKTNSYVPPHLRGKVQEAPKPNPEIEKIEKEIQEVENEIKKIKNKIEEEEKVWQNDRKKYHFNEIWNKMYKV